MRSTVASVWPSRSSTPPGAGLERKYMPRAVQVRWRGVIGDGGPHGPDAILGRDPGGHALGDLDADRERGLIAAGIGFDHGTQVQGADFFLGQTQADDATALADEHGHLGRGQALGSEDEVAFVFTIFVIGDKHSPALAQGFESALDPGARGQLVKRQD